MVREHRKVISSEPISIGKSVRHRSQALPNDRDIERKTDINNAKDVLLNNIKKLTAEQTKAKTQEKRKDYSKLIAEMKVEMEELDSELEIEMGIELADKNKTEAQISSIDSEVDMEVETSSAITAINPSNEEIKPAIENAKQWLTPHESLVSEGMDSIIGHTNVKQLLTTHIAAPLKIPPLFEDRKMIESILLIGPPGTGKTLLVKAFAKDTGLNFFDVRGSGILSKFVGSGEKQVNALFYTALQNEPAIIFIDEADNLLSKRSDTNQGKGLTNEFMQAMTDLDKLNRKVYVIAATNHPELIDPAAFRRFHSEKMALPGDREREQIWRSKFSKHKKEMSKIDYEQLSELSEGYSGSDIDRIAKKVLGRPVDEILSGVSLKDMEFMDASKEDLRKITMEDFEIEIDANLPTVSKAQIKELDEWWAR